MKKNNAGGLFANKNKGKRFNFEGKNTGTDQLVRGEVVAKDEEEARKKLQRRGIKPLRISKVKPRASGASPKPTSPCLPASSPP